MSDDLAPSERTSRFDQLVRVLPSAASMPQLVYAIVSAAALIPSALTTLALGVSDSGDPTPWPLAVPAVTSLAMAFLIHLGTDRASAGQHFARDLSRVSRGIGLVLERRHWARATVLGLLGAGVATLLGEFLVRVPALAATNVPDARDSAVAGHPAWVQGLYFATRTALLEELVYRGALVALAYMVCRYIRPGSARVAVLTSLSRADPQRSPWLTSNPPDTPNSWRP